ncbi:MAG TPA: ATP-binding cassette domain-containing protein, partial [Dehalococcoidia bacterium]|nr:ATP-binding cassette domain-containing protein [Dehalococcoidia bacterium]
MNRAGDVGLLGSRTRKSFNEQELGQRRIMVEAKGFSVFYGNNEAVKGVTLSFRERVVTAIIGPSGCGKSTLLRAINRMNDLIPSCHVAGELLVDKMNIYGSNVDVVSLRRAVGMVFQQPNVFPKSVYDNVAYGPRLHGALSRGQMDQLVEVSLRRAALWDEV